MHNSAMQFAKMFRNKYLADTSIQNTIVAEIGSLDVNGSIREIFSGVSEYIGMDFEQGKGVDIVIDDPYELPLEDSSVDIVVCSSCYEHSELFWLSFLECMRILKDGGLFYLNVPSNGFFHQWPVDCWRFYPDSGHALVKWGKRNGYSVELLESFIGDFSDGGFEDGGMWCDFVAVFSKDASGKSAHQQRILDSLGEFFNGYRSDSDEILNFSALSPDFQKIKNQIYHVSELELTVESRDKIIKSEKDFNSELQAQIHKLNQEIENIVSSKTWRLISFLKAVINNPATIFPPYSRTGFAAKVLTAKGFHLRWPIKFRRFVKKILILSEAEYPLAGKKLGDEKVVAPESDRHQRFLENLRHERSAIHSKQKITPIKCLNFDENNLLFEASKIKFKQESEPRISIVIPVYNNLKLTLECLASIASSYSIEKYEVIIADDCSDDESYSLLKKIPGLKFHRNDENLGFLRNCNSAVSLANGEYVVFLNNDVQVSDNWLDGLLRVFTLKGDAGSVGPKILYPQGYLQEAGVTIRPDSSVAMLGLNGQPSLPRYNYIREVDYCSGAALMVPLKLFKELGGFADEFAPAYCEDADLAMRLMKLGYKNYYTPEAEVVHHLSKTMNTISDDWKTKQAQLNISKFHEKWSDDLDHLNKIRSIAFYLPQFHVIPENNEWWGEGFTEWTNVRKAKPNYEGHLQPREPLDLGYYDLDDATVLEKQAALASRFGVDGFCFYYYWFDGKRLLEKPLDQALEKGNLQIPFCLCWANENWTRRWDGEDNEILIAQNHSDDDDEAVILDIIRYFRSDKYIKIDGKPLLLVYKVDLFPNFSLTAARWRRICREQGIGEICLAMVEVHNFVDVNYHPQDFGCDYSVEFAPHNNASSAKVNISNPSPDFEGNVSDYELTALRYCLRKLPPFKRFNCVMPGWDNTARRKGSSFVFDDPSPAVFQAWAEDAFERTREQFQGEERIVFINAWNEWAEGAYLEPDKHFGYQNLEAIWNAKDANKYLKREEPLAAISDYNVTLLGHLYSPIGMGEHVRCTHRALRALSVSAGVLDIYKLDELEENLMQEFGSFEVFTNSDINIFHINADEVAQVLSHLEMTSEMPGYNIIYPAWELSKFPLEWAAKLNLFDEIWAPSQFIFDAIEKSTSSKLTLMPLATEVSLETFRRRSYYGIPEFDYTFLFFFDVRSYSTRKNPLGVISAFERVVNLRPNAPLTLIIKVLGSERNPDLVEKIKKRLERLKANYIIIDNQLNDNDVKNLIRCSDCFVSLHRSEGYGRGIAEAMDLGKPVIATGYSGNMDFMTKENSFPVDFDLIDVQDGEYPFSEGQVWAEPSIDHAVDLMTNLVDFPEVGVAKGEMARRSIRRHFSYRCVGNRMMKRINQIKVTLDENAGG